MLKDILDEIDGIEYRAGKEYLPTDDMYYERLSSFASSLDKRADYILECIKNCDIEKLVFESHSMKNNAKTVGAVKLSETALAAEMASRSGDKADALEKCALLADSLQNLYKALEQFVAKPQVFTGVKVDDEDKLRTLEAIRKSIRSFDVDGASEKMVHLRQLFLTEGEKVLVNELQNKIDIFEYSDAAAIVDRLTGFGK